MRMRDGIQRILRILFVAAVAWLGFHWLRPRGLGWVALLVIGLGVAGYLAFRAWRLKKSRDQDAQADRWAEALMDPPRRPEAIREILEAREGLAKDRPKEAERHASLTLVLAELLEADGDPERAVEALSEVHDTALDESLSAIVRHARAVSYLSAGDPAGAAAALDELPGPCGDRAVDLRIQMMRGLIAAESGDTEAALEIARVARDEAAGDRDLELEARVLEAVARDASGDRAAALRTLARIDDEMVDVLLVLGLPRVRELASALIEERE